MFNSKITSIPYDKIKPYSVRISILDENIDEINNIIEHVKNNEIFSSPDYTYGNFNKNV